MKRANWDYYFNRWMLFLIIFAGHRMECTEPFMEYVKSFIYLDMCNVQHHGGI